jgi:hypothetical protein
MVVLYDLAIAPLAARLLGRPISMTVRIGAGFAIQIVALVSAGLIELARYRLSAGVRAAFEAAGPGADPLDPAFTQPMRCAVVLCAPLAVCALLAVCARVSVGDGGWWAQGAGRVRSAAAATASCAARNRQRPHRRRCAHYHAQPRTTEHAASGGRRCPTSCLARPRCSQTS